MDKKASRVLVALSGGVDSSTAAAILLKEGYDCSGVFMITHDRAVQAQNSAEKAAKQMGIELHVLDVRDDFEKIIVYFCSEYQAGKTPNPCVVCNKNMKFGKLWEFARSCGAEFLATGHYARILPTNDDKGLFTAADEAKDQSYALAMIDKKMLEHIILPMGRLTKMQTRQIAREMGLPTAGSRESQEICFIPDNNHISFLENRCPGIIGKGRVVDITGRVLGEHDGIHRFTIGQRRGVKIAMGRPWYVVKLDAETNTVTLGPKDEVMHTKLIIDEVNWLIKEPESQFRAKVKIRYNAKAVDANLIPKGRRFGIEFDEPVSAITPGQLAVFYIREQNNIRVAGAGWIEKAAD